jgi:hypothetical protein
MQTHVVEALQVHGLGLCVPHLFPLSLYD